MDVSRGSQVPQFDSLISRIRMDMNLIGVWTCEIDIGNLDPHCISSSTEQERHVVSLFFTVYRTVFTNRDFQRFVRRYQVNEMDRTSEITERDVVDILWVTQLSLIDERRCCLPLPIQHRSVNRSDTAELFCRNR